MAQGEDPWDEETFAQLERDGAVELRITHIERRVSFGQSDLHCGYHEGGLWTIIGGYLPRTRQLAHIQLQFRPELDSFGVATCTFYQDQPFGILDVQQPVIEVFLRDETGAIAVGMHDALRDAVASGKNAASAWLWASFPDGWRDRNAQRLATFDVTGCHVWSILSSVTTPSWALPIGKGDLTSYPNPSMLRLSPKRTR